ncbi:DUF7344 domain-containing protein [Natronosalvus hydrolyticus]|uniref:DUF7344 domain-containing protein n=1 Tax=Natronosalvus hydrolyticus TaxID=2979988 RepID=UPI003CCC4DC1
MSGNNCGDDFLSIVYHSLRAPRRRYVIELVAMSEEGVLSVRTLARKIAAQEQGVSTDCATGEPYRNVYNALSQTHLSTLSNAEIIIYEPKRQTVTAGPNLTIARLLSNLNETAYRTLEKKQTNDSDECL